MYIGEEKSNNKNEKIESKKHVFKFKKLKRNDIKKKKSFKRDDDILVENDLVTKNGVKDPSKTKNSKNGKNNSKKKKTIKIILFTLLALFIIGTGVIIGVITGVIDKSDDFDINAIALKQNSVFLDKDGNNFDAVYSSENRSNVEYKDIPKTLVDAVVSIEDERFFKHKGVDVKRTAGAIFSYVIHFGKSSFGGSTLTQQLVKNLTEDKKTTWERKIREWYRATQLEKKLNKEQIFEMYANTIYLGDGCYGVESASEHYFGKAVKDLNLAESATIAAKIQSPENYDPYKSDKNKQLLLDREKVVLKQMLKLKKIDQKQYDDAQNYQLEFKKNDDYAAAATKIHSYYVDAVFEKVQNDLISQKGMSKEAAQEMIYSGGLKIYTPYDSSVQDAVNDAYDNSKIFYTEKNGDFMQSAMVVMDQSNGNVVALIGGAGDKTGNLVFNRATDAKRQPGSTMKPLAAYGPAFEQGIAGPGTGVDDSPMDTSADGGYDPHNYYNYYNGYVSIRQALAKSMNLPAVKTLQKVGVDYAYNFAKNCGLYDLSGTEDKHLSMAIGGLYNGVTVMEMANAYATIADGGIHIDPKLYTKVEDGNGKVILSTDDYEAKRVMKATTAYLLTDCMESVIKSGGTAYGYVKLGKIAVAGKTGETDDEKDQWFIGYTPYYTVACWNGYDTPRTIKRAYPYASIKLFNTVMQAISKDQKAKDFDKPDGIVTATICKVSGLVPTDACRQDPRGDQTTTDIFASDAVPTKACDIHKLIKIDPTNGLLANDDTPNAKEISVITRDYIPSTIPLDWKNYPELRAPTEYSTNKKQEDEKTTQTTTPGGTVDIYLNTNIQNKTNVTTKEKNVQ